MRFFRFGPLLFDPFDSLSLYFLYSQYFFSIPSSQFLVHWLTAIISRFEVFKYFGDIISKESWNLSSPFQFCLSPLKEIFIGFEFLPNLRVLPLSFVTI